ncbi:hypothetical protein PUN28_000926 [Cardiocondyla obscurior]|uniref:Uncharacterized protein n=1 Tax=Cardiocondyla obscurior TaxID=286306 RepID=A0AAW2H1R7_9HYME
MSYRNKKKKKNEKEEIRLGSESRRYDADRRDIINDVRRAFDTGSLSSGHLVERNRARRERQRRLICCFLMICRINLPSPQHKEALRIAQIAVLAVVLALRKPNIIINIDCLYCCNMA